MEYYPHAAALYVPVIKKLRSDKQKLEKENEKLMEEKEKLSAIIHHDRDAFRRFTEAGRKMARAMHADQSIEIIDEIIDEEESDDEEITDEEESDDEITDESDDSDDDEEEDKNEKFIGRHVLLRRAPTPKDTVLFMNALGWDLCHIRARGTWADGKDYKGKVMPEIATLNPAAPSLKAGECFFYFDEEENFDAIPVKDVRNILSDWNCGSETASIFRMTTTSGDEYEWSINMGSVYWFYRFNGKGIDDKEHPTELWLRESIALVRSKLGNASHISKLNFLL